MTERNDSFVPSSSKGAKGKALVVFVGNKLMLDDGIGPYAYEDLLEAYQMPDNVLLKEVGCMSLDLIPYVRDCDLVVTVDAVLGTGEPAGTVFEFSPEDMARNSGANASLHDLKLVDLFDAAMLLGYEAEGICLGMQAENIEPAEYVVGLTPQCADAMPLLVETIAATLHRHGYDVRRKDGSDLPLR
ncbi:MAG: hydrogenase maturation protease [Coriobacteriia bacterium]|nr:hydrogenase maturation protease [Coriobacteriia bacterium]